MSAISPPVSQDQVERKVASLRLSGFSEQQLRRACDAVVAESLPLRDAIVLRKAKEYDEQQTVRAVAAWAAIRPGLQRSVAESTWRIWLEPLALVGEEGDALLLTAPEGIRAWSERRYSSLIGEALRATDSGFDRAVFVSGASA